MGWFRRRDCRAHQAALVDFATHRADGPDIQRALGHVDRCRACEADLAATTLVLHALCRLHEESSRADVPPDGWVRLRARLATNRREPSLLMSCLPGIALAVVLLVAVADLPALRGTGPVLDDGSTVVLRHTSVDDSRPADRNSVSRAATRLVARPTVRAQDRTRPVASLPGPRAVDSPMSVIAEPAVAEPASAPQDGAPDGAHTRWR